MSLLILLTLIGFSAVSIDILVPALPEIALDYKVTEQAAQSVLSSFLIGAAVGTLICGMLADRHGRRHPILIGTVIYVVASVGCFYSKNLEALSFWRMLQGMGASVGPTLSAAVVGDIYSRNQAASMLSRLAGFMALLPAVAPFIGCYTILHFHWNGIFVFLLVFGTLLFLGVYRQIPETHVGNGHAKTDIRDYLHAKLRVLTHVPFALFSLTAGFSFGGLFAYISANSFLIIEVLGVSHQYFAFTFLVVSVGFFAGSQIGAHLLRKFDIETIVMAGALISSVVAGVALAFALGGVISLWVLLIPACLYTLGVGFTLSAAQVGAMKSRPDEMATASGITNCIRIGLAAIAGHLALENYSGDATTMFTVMLLCALVALAFSLPLFITRQKRKIPGITATI